MYLRGKVERVRDRHRIFAREGNGMHTNNALAFFAISALYHQKI